jgi:lysylphosphatidylglycerol synthetase-like protein (DUF2156 family)
MKQDFYTFFLPATIPNRRAAISAVSAGVIAGSLLTLVMGVAGVAGLLRGGGKSQTTVVVLAAAVLLLIATVGTWKRILSAPVIGLLVGIGVVGWALWHRELAVAILLVVPFVGGFWTAARGIVTLKRMNALGNSRGG